MRKTIPENMFAGKDSARLTLLQDWVLQHAVTEIEMNERQFWNFVSRKNPQWQYIFELIKTFVLNFSAN